MNFKALLENKHIQYLLRLNSNIQEDYIGLVAGGVAFYFFLAAFPALAALISVYGLFSNPSFVSEQLMLLDGFLPPESLKILSDQALKITTSNTTALSFGLFMGLALTIYSATKGVKALMQGLNIAFNLKERRNIVILNGTAFTLTFVLMIYFLFSLSLVAFMPAIFNFLFLPDYITSPLLLLRWPLLMLSAMVGLQMLYFYGPNHYRPKWKLFSWGALIATALWIGGCNLFSLFVSNFGNYNETYGSLGAVAVLLLWFWLSALIVLIGAEINAAFDDNRDPKRFQVNDLDETGTPEA